MLRAIELGKNALGSAGPNPMVGCIIVCDNAIIGEGYTSPFGGPHAEVNAINAVKNKSLLAKATLYVTLEPCSHFGKTPPCSDLIIEHKIPNVVIGLKDPHIKVAGQGIDRLKAAGVGVELGVLENECRKHHKRFLTFHEKKRPYIILKWAETWNGLIAPTSAKRAESPEPYWITNQHSRQLVHQWRTEEQAVLVGTKTVMDDNPRLDVRHVKGRSPVRVVLDRSLKISSEFHVMDGTTKTIVLTDKKNTPDSSNISFEQIEFNRDLAHSICAILYKHEINSIIIEGGAKTIQTFLNSGLWDEARVFRGNTLFENGICAPQIQGKIIETKNIVDDQLTILHHDPEYYS